MFGSQSIVRNILLATVSVAGIGMALVAAACPFCSALNLTYSEQMKSNDVVVIAKLLEIPPPIDDPDAELPRAEFEVTQVIKGEKYVTKEMKFRSLLVGRYPIGQKFLVMGVDPPKIAWSTPMKASDRVIKYIEKLPELPKSGGDRLAFFQNYFEDSESVLAFDAYDEFAIAPYEDLIELKDRMDRDKLIKWIRDPDISVNRRRLYFTMLGVCGKPADTTMLEEFIESGDRKKQAGLDALIACYLNLKGEAGVDLVEKTFLRNKEVDYVDTLAAVSALRFHGTEMELIPKERIVKAIRHLLDRPKMADMIIPDLARWEDWSVMERLVQMFKDADEETNWLRVPVITYLRACPRPEAKKYIEELAKIDPDAVRRADFFLEFDEPAEDESTDADSSDDGDEADGESESDGSNDKSNPDGRLSDSQTEPISLVSHTSVAANAVSAESAKLRPTNELTTVRRVPLTSKSIDAEVASGQVSQANDPRPPTESNPEPASLVTNGAPAAASNRSTSERVAVSGTSSGSVAAGSAGHNLTLPIIFVPMAVSAVIFLLLLSVMNGWFARLIY